MRAELLAEFVAVEHPQDRRFKDITGNAYGRLTAVSYAGAFNKNHKWNCLCACGNRVAVASGRLKNGQTQSCGCLHAERMHEKNSTHGASGVAPEYNSYCGAKARCANPAAPAYADYGGRGIEFRFDSYEHFLAVLGQRPGPRFSIDRIDVNGHYEPGNVRWATQGQQNRNRRNNLYLTINGVTKCQSDWAAAYGIPAKAVHRRRRRGWCDTCAVTLPLLPVSRKGQLCTHKGHLR